MDPRLCAAARHSRRIYRRGRRAACGLEPLLRGLCRAFAGRYRAPLRLRRPASARGRRHLSRARRDRRPDLAAEPSAAHHRRGRLAAIDRGHRPARPIARNGAARSLWRGPAGRRRRAAGGRDCRQQRISARGLRRQTARRPLSSLLRRRCRPRPGRALVGAERPHAGAVGRGLRAGKPPGAVARLFQPLQVDECRARRAVLRGVSRQLARQRRARRAAHRPADAGRLQRDLFRTRHAGALSRLPAGRGRRPRRQRRPHSYPHHRGAEAARRAAAPGRFQFPRSARAECVVASRRARPDRRAAQERRRRRQHAGLGRIWRRGRCSVSCRACAGGCSAKI